MTLSRLLTGNVGHASINGHRPISLVTRVAIINLFFRATPGPLTRIINNFINGDGRRRLVSVRVQVFFRRFSGTIGRCHYLPHTD